MVAISRRLGRNATPDGPGISFSAILSDIVIWIVATDLAALVRYDLDVNDVRWEAISVLALFLAGAHLIVGALVVMYRGRYEPGSFDEMRALAVSATTVAVLAGAVLAALRPNGIPRSVPFAVWALALVGMAAIRVIKRIITQSASRARPDAERALILGAGWLGSALALRMQREPGSRFLPVGFLDDDPAKRNLQLHGVRVQGHFDELATVANRLGATTVVVAVNNADAELLRAVSDAADDAGIACLVVPPLQNVVGKEQVQLSALREIDVQDVIGRRPVDTDVASIAKYITGKRVLVTGAGGSIGSELCRQLHRFGPAELVMLDRDESALHAVELSIHGRALLESPEIVLVDIRDQSALDVVFLEHQPQVVFHAAALKHLPLLERYPHEALKTNVYGTLNVLRAAAANGVEHFVNVSTDKAADPCSALGHSKRLAERLTAWFAAEHRDGKFLSVRFGNVLGSRGSVLHAFAAQIEGGGPVTVTDPEVTRYFMTIPEACQLVIQAGAVGHSGEALVLDMGQPVKIVDVAQRMIAMAGRDVEIVFTGLREGEKLHEVLIAQGEHDERPLHPLISHVAIPALRPESVHSEPWARRALSRTDRLPVMSAVPR